MFNLLTSDTKRSITAICLLIYSIITVQRNMKDNIFYKWQPNHITCGLIYHKYIFILTIVTISSATFIMFYLCSCEIFRRRRDPIFRAQIGFSVSGLTVQVVTEIENCSQNRELQFSSNFPRDLTLLRGDLPPLRFFINVFRTACLAMLKLHDF